MSIFFVFSVLKSWLIYPLSWPASRGWYLNVLGSIPAASDTVDLRGCRWSSANYSIYKKKNSIKFPLKCHRQHQQVRTDLTKSDPLGSSQLSSHYLAKVTAPVKSSPFGSKVRAGQRSSAVASWKELSWPKGDLECSQLRSSRIWHGTQ